MPRRRLLDNIDWRTYSRFLRLFAERPGYRLTYDRGVLEIMSPRFDHEQDSYLLGRFVDDFTVELGLKVKAGRSTTFRRRRKKRHDDVPGLSTERDLRPGRPQRGLSIRHAC